MPFALLIIGLALLASAIQGTQQQFLDLLVIDFSGPSNFTYWVLALLLIGAVGYIPKARPVSDAFLVLVVLVLVLSKGNPSQSGGGFFAQLTQALSTTNTQQALPDAASTTAATATTAASNTISSLLNNFAG